MQHVSILYLSGGPFDLWTACLTCIVNFGEIVVGIVQESRFHLLFNLWSYLIALKMNDRIYKVLLYNNTAYYFPVSCLVILNLTAASSTAGSTLPLTLTLLELLIDCALKHL